ncbi:hypothetical protein Tco_1535603, partial [Tanacetum coccineum]
YGYTKNHKKTVKNRQARTRERKSEQKPKEKSSSQVIKVKSRDSLAHSQSKGHVINGKSTKRCGICTKFTHPTSTSEPQMDCQLGNPCELTSDPTAIKLDQMIAMIGWQRLKEVGRGSGPRSFSLSL